MRSICPSVTLKRTTNGAGYRRSTEEREGLWWAQWTGGLLCSLVLTGRAQWTSLPLPCVDLASCALSSAGLCIGSGGWQKAEGFSHSSALCHSGLSLCSLSKVVWNKRKFKGEKWVWRETEGIRDSNGRGLSVTKIHYIQVWSFWINILSVSKWSCGLASPLTLYR